MRIVVQRVCGAKVEVDSKVTGQIDKGLLVYLSVTHNDTETDAKFIADKITNLRIFGDDGGKMNLSLTDVRTGIFAANMQVTSTNDGPVTFILDTEKTS
ncbi:MAG: hypothetical protein FVQ80_00205 [Planctomycetes bacterium]|nr:hypothetical protein [Planctomycetota bacterium]